MSRRFADNCHTFNHLHLLTITLPSPSFSMSSCITPWAGQVDIWTSFSHNENVRDISRDLDREILGSWTRVVGGEAAYAWAYQ